MYVDTVVMGQSNSWRRVDVNAVQTITCHTWAMGQLRTNHSLARAGDAGEVWQHLKMNNERITVCADHHWPPLPISSVQVPVTFVVVVGGGGGTVVLLLLLFPLPPEMRLDRTSESNCVIVLLLVSWCLYFPSVFPSSLFFPPPPLSFSLSY